MTNVSKMTMSLCRQCYIYICYIYKVRWRYGWRAARL